MTDITEHRTAEGKLYLCAIKDVCSNRIVDDAMDARMTASLAVSALRNAITIWIERTYHCRRRQRRLGRLTPTEYETLVTDRRAA